MGFLKHCFLFAFFGPGRTVILYFSVPVALYTVFLRPSSRVHWLLCPPNLGQKSGHADHVKTLETLSKIVKTLRNIVKTLKKHSKNLKKTRGGRGAGIIVIAPEILP